MELGKSKTVDDGAVQGKRGRDPEAAGRGGGEIQGWLVILLGLLPIAGAVLLLYASALPAPVTRASALRTPLASALRLSASRGYTTTLPLLFQAPPTPTATSTNTPTATPTATLTATPTLTPTATPIITPTATPTITATPAPVTDPIVYDCEGDISTTYWLTTTFGAVTWTLNESIPLSAVHARCGDQPAVIIAHVEDSSGRPLENITVVFSWPDAPILPPELHNCGLDRGVYGPTNVNGDIGFGLGPGAYYFPPSGGPHTVWLPGGACLAGLGMLGGTNHEHVDGDWTVLAQMSTLSPDLHDLGFSPQCPVYFVDIDGRELWVIKCGQ